MPVVISPLVYAFCFFSFLFLLKVLWNLVVPYRLGYRFFRDDKRGIPLRWQWELFGLIPALIFGFLAGLPVWPLILWGFGLYLFCYVHLVTVGLLLAFIVGKLKPERMLSEEELVVNKQDADDSNTEIQESELAA